MAAFENISRITLRPHNQETDIDVRTARLPPESPDDDYDPALHRHPKQPIGKWMAYFNIVRTCFGAGVLGLPLATSQAGIILGPILNLFTGVLIIHTHLTLLRCLNEISRQLKIPYISYRYGFRMALLRGPPLIRWMGQHGPCAIAVLMCMSQLGICSVFVIFTSDSLRDIMDWTSSSMALLVLLVPYLLLQYCMRTLKIVSYISLAGNFMNFAGMIIVFAQIIKEPHGEIITYSTRALPFLFAFGTYLFNMSAVGVVLSIDKACVDPTLLTKRFGVIQIGMAVPTVICTIFGALGYWSFGTMEENILRALPYDQMSSMIAIGLYLVAIAFAVPIQSYPAVQIILEVIKNRKSGPPPDDILNTLEVILRPIIVCASFLVSYIVPYQGPFVAFVGNLCTTLLCLVFPALMELSLKYPTEYGKYNFYLIKNLLLIAIGLISMIFGVVLCGYLIYIRIRHTQAPPSNLFL